MKQFGVLILFGLAMAIKATELSSPRASKSDHERFRRFLIFPAATPTRMQVINTILNNLLPYEYFASLYPLKPQPLLLLNEIFITRA